MNSNRYTPASASTKRSPLQHPKGKAQRNTSGACYIVPQQQHRSAQPFV